MELWGMQSNPLVQSLPGPLWPSVVASNRGLFMGQIELNCVPMPNWIVWNRPIYIYIYMSVCVCVWMGFALNNSQSWICHKTKPNQTKLNQSTNSEAAIFMQYIKNNGIMTRNREIILFASTIIIIIIIIKERKNNF